MSWRIVFRQLRGMALLLRFCANKGTIFSGIACCFPAVVRQNGNIGRHRKGGEIPVGGSFADKKRVFVEYCICYYF